MSNTTTLSKFQVKRITNRFSSSSVSKTKYHNSNHNIIVINQHAILFLSKSVIDYPIDNYSISKHDAIIQASLEESYIHNSTQSPICLSLDQKLIESIISSLNRQQSNLYTSLTKTIITYDKSINELSFNTISHDASDSISYYRPCLVSDTTDSFTVTLDTGTLINTLITQKETDQFTTIELDTTQSNHIRFKNDISTIVVNCIR